MNNYLLIRERMSFRLTGTAGASDRTITITSVMTIPIVRTKMNVTIDSVLSFVPIRVIA
jgi:hypothetical protein